MYADCLIIEYLISHLPHKSMTMSNQRQRIIKVCNINNAAVDLLQTGAYSGAIVQLREALGSAQREVVSAATSSADEDSSQCSKTDLGSSMNAPRAKIFSVKVGSPVCNEDLHEEEVGVNIFCFYDRAFCFEIEEDGLDLDVDTICSILLYNIGVSYQMMGTPQALVVTRTFYDMSLQIVTQDEPNSYELGPQHHGSKNLFLLSLFNNIGYLHQHFMAVDSMRKCLKAMQSVPMQLSDDDNNSTAEFDFFYRHTLSFQSALVIIAAPSA